MSLSQQDILAYLRDDLNVDEDIDAGTELFSGGILDSVSMVSLITFIEEKTGAVIQPGDVTLENFDTVDRISAYVATLG
ncbi:acyl carrier protein [Paracoccus shanxieyensis]|uniref:Acyl carrier protein n=1 Tax=Paracoccus shanxieyensis TaxID=2675752 RepID=A0A6L6IY97_9RHOB|nr:acyl carrier protein [Paracoccus shanxieyensis]MTH63554.1 acyl carrier protein [Paracoccus shanxieyensis]MTH86475.1 acyl carrier protein [Paracoccus shanxieyensis]